MTAWVLTTQKAILCVPRHDAGGLEPDRVRVGCVEMPREYGAWSGLPAWARSRPGTSPRRSPKDTEAASAIVTPATATPFAVRYQLASTAQSAVNASSEL